MTDKEVMQMALGALERALSDDQPYIVSCKQTVEALRAALAQPERAECDGGQCGIGGYCKQCPKTQPEREWVGLTEEERLEILGVGGEAAVLYVTEAKLREKNNG